MALSRTNNATELAADPNARQLPAQGWAFVCIVVAWLLGILVFELPAEGAESKNRSADPASILSPNYKLRPMTMIDAITKTETLDAVATTRIEGLLRVKKNLLLKDKIEAAIIREEFNLAKLASTRVNQPQTRPDFQADGLAVDPVLNLMPIAKWVTQMAYRQHDQDVGPSDLRSQTDRRFTLDQARVSDLPGLMRLAVGSKRYLSTISKTISDAKQVKPSDTTLASNNQIVRQSSHESEAQIVRGASVVLPASASSVISTDGLVSAIAEPIGTTIRTATMDREVTDGIELPSVAMQAERAAEKAVDDQFAATKQPIVFEQPIVFDPAVVIEQPIVVATASSRRDSQ